MLRNAASRMLWISMFGLSLLCGTLTQVTAQEFHRFDDVKELKFIEGVQVYVLGDPYDPMPYDQPFRAMRALSDASRYAALAEELAQVDPAAVVVLVEQARGQSLRYEEQSFENRAAVVAAMDLKLFNDPKFLALKGDAEGEMLQQRWIILYTFDDPSAGGNEQRHAMMLSSKFQEHFGVSRHRDWLPNQGRKKALIEIAKPYLLSRNLHLAVLEVVKEAKLRVDTEVKRRDEVAKEAAKRRAEELARQKREAESRVASADNALKALKELHEEFRKANPELKGELTQSNWVAYDNKLADAKQKLVEEDFRSARRLGFELLSMCRTYTTRIEEYPATERELNELQERFEQLQGHEFASEIEYHLEHARSLLQTAQKSWERAELYYLRKVGDAKKAVDSLQPELQRAEKRAYDAMIMTRLVTFLAIFVLLAILLMANFERKSEKMAALSIIASWESQLAELEKKLLDVNRKRRRLTVISPDSRFTGRTLEVYGKATEEIGEAYVLYTLGNEHLARARETIAPQEPVLFLLWWVWNLFWGGNYKRATDMLRDAKLSADPQWLLDRRAAADARAREQDKFHVATGSERDLLAIVPESIVVGPMGMDGACKRADDLLGYADRALNSIDGARDLHAELAERYSVLVTECEADFARLEDVGPRDYRMLLPGLPELVQRCQYLSTNASITVLRDPLQAVKDTQGAVDRLEWAESLLGKLVQQLQEVAPEVRNAEETLAELGVSQKWSSARWEEIFTLVEAAFGALKESPDVELPDVEGLFERLSYDLETAARYESDCQDEIEPQIVELGETVETTRSELGSVLRVDSSTVLTEEGQDPDEILHEVAELRVSVKGAIEVCDFDAAASFIDSARQKLERVEEIVADSKAAQANYQTTVDEIVDVAADLESAETRHEEVLESLADTYAPEVLELLPNESVAGSNLTIADNLDEIGAAVEGRDELLSAAEAAYEDARLLECAELLRQAAATNEFIAACFEEIVNVDGAVEQVLNRNHEVLDEHRARILELQEVCEDARVGRESKECVDATMGLLVSLTNAAGVDGSNPFDIENSLEGLRREIEASYGLIEGDFQEFAEATRSGKIAERALGTLEQEHANVRGKRDRAGDSRAIDNVGKSIRGLRNRLDAAERRLKEAHLDWREVDVAFDKLAAEIADHRSVLRREAQAAAAAVAAIASSSEQCNEARHWRGTYGTTIYGSPGSDTLAAAKQALANGNYSKASRLAGEAKSEAASAITLAVAQDLLKMPVFKPKSSSTTSVISNILRPGGGIGGGFGGFKSGGGGGIGKFTSSGVGGNW